MAFSGFAEMFVRFAKVLCFNVPSPFFSLSQFFVVSLYVNNINIQGNMEKESTKKMTREDALRRLEEARKLKREYVKELEKKMKEDFKKRTGQEATYFEVW